jgi:hypothetical protein
MKRLEAECSKLLTFRKRAPARAPEQQLQAKFRKGWAQAASCPCNRNRQRNYRTVCVLLPKDNSREAGGKRISRDNEARFDEPGSDPQRSDARITAIASPPHEFDINPPKTLAVYLRAVCLAGHDHLSTRIIRGRDLAGC